MILFYLLLHLLLGLQENDKGPIANQSMATPVDDLISSELKNYHSQHAISLLHQKKT